MSGTKPVLGYWAVRGLGMQLRLMLKYCQVNFEEELYPQVFDDTATGYNRWNGDAWWNVWDKQGLPFPNLPYFKDGEAKITMSSAIARYICAKWKPELLGVTPLEVGNAAMLEMALVDFNAALDKISFSDDGTREQLIECAKEHLTPVHTFLGGNDFLVGENITFPDFILFEMIDKCQDEHMFNGKFYETFPKFQAYQARIQALPNVMTFEERKAYGLFNGWRAKLGGAGEEMFKKYRSEPTTKKE